MTFANITTTTNEFSLLLANSHNGKEKCQENLFSHNMTAKKWIDAWRRFFFFAGKLGLKELRKLPQSFSLDCLLRLSLLLEHYWKKCSSDLSENCGGMKYVSLSHSSSLKFFTIFSRVKKECSGSWIGILRMGREKELLECMENWNKCSYRSCIFSEYYKQYFLFVVAVRHVSLFPLLENLCKWKLLR